MQYSLVLMGTVALAGAVEVVHRQPVASSVFPQGARPGETLEAELLGEHLDGLEAAHTSTLRVEILSGEATRVRVRVSVPATAAFGHHLVQFSSRRGVSNPVLFRVGDLPHVLENEPNSLPGEAQTVSLPATIQGRLHTDGDFDFFRFHAEKGTHWIFDLRAARNGNGLDAALLLYDAKGRKLAHSEERFIWDPFLSHTFAQSGDYVVAIQPTHRNNDPNFAYALDIRRSPHIDTVSPISLREGENELILSGAGFQPANGRLEFSDSRLTGRITAMSGTQARALVTVPAGVPDGRCSVTVVTEHGRSNTVDVRLDREASIQAHARYRDPHRFPLEAKAGEEFVVEARSQQYGTPADLTLRIVDSAGKTVAQNDDFTYPGSGFYQKDPRVRHKFAAAGSYTVELRNLVDTPSEAMPFQLVMGPPRPSFEPILDSERIALFPGQTKKIRVAANRVDGHAGPIPIQLEGLPEGVTANAAMIADSKGDGEIELTASAMARPGTAAPVSVTAGGKHAWRNVRISSGGGEGAAFAKAGHLMVAVAEKPLFSLEAAVTSVNLPRGGTARVPVVIARDASQNKPISFRVENLPAGVSVRSAEAKPGEDKLDLILQATADAPKSRAARVAILGISAGQQQEAPRISVLVD